MTHEQCEEAALRALDAAEDTGDEGHLLFLLAKAQAYATLAVAAAISEQTDVQAIR